MDGETIGMGRVVVAVVLLLAVADLKGRGGMMEEVVDSDGWAWVQVWRVWRRRWDGRGGRIGRTSRGGGTMRKVQVAIRTRGRVSRLI